MRDLIPLFVTILSGYRKIFKIKENLNLFACLHNETFFGEKHSRYLFNKKATPNYNLEKKDLMNVCSSQGRYFRPSWFIQDLTP